ncbi:unnamed protein product, partial [Discosporangium mesarthrocarpum]
MSPGMSPGVKKMSMSSPLRGPCVRFQGIELEMGSYAGCQFDVAKDGSLVVTLDRYTGTIVLRSGPGDVSLSDAGSLAGGCDAEIDMDIGIALSQLEQESPTVAPYPSDVRSACLGTNLSQTSFTKKSSPTRRGSPRRSGGSLSALISPPQETTVDNLETSTSPARGAPKRSAGILAADSPVPETRKAVSPEVSIASTRVIPKKKKQRRSRNAQEEEIGNSSSSSSKTEDTKIAGIVATKPELKSKRSAPPARIAAAVTVAEDVATSIDQVSSDNVTAPVVSDVAESASSVPKVEEKMEEVAMRRVDSNAPMGRWGHTATMISDSRMLVLGGQADDEAHQATLGDLYKYDFATGRWSRPVNCDSVPRAWHTASFLEGKNLLVIFGGERTVDGCPECLDDIMVLDTDIDLFYPPAISGKPPTARSGHSAAIVGKDLIVFGGVRGRKWQNKVSVLDTERWHWRHPTIDGSAPAPRSYHSATVVGGLMVVIGGNNQNESFSKVYVLDTSE